MAREKKITVKPYLNKTLKSVDISADSDNYYPIYFLVTYNRKVTKFPSPVNWHYPEDQEDSLNEDERVSDMIHRIKSIVRYEINKSTDYTIVGIGKRLKVYYGRLFPLIDYVNGAFLRTKDFEVKSLPGGTPYQERIAAGILTVANSEPAPHELYYLARFIEATYPTFSVYQWTLEGSRKLLLGDLERGYHAGHGVDYEHANRLQSGVRMNCGLEDLEKILDQIVNISAYENLTLFSDLQLNIESVNSNTSIVFEVLK